MKLKPTLALAAALAASALDARADAVTEWNHRAGEILAAARLGTPPAIRAMALVHTAVHEAVLAAPGEAADAAVAAASRAVLAKLVPAQQAAIDAAYRAAMDRIAETAAKAAATSAGEHAARQVLERRADDKPGADEYRPHAAPGAYVPTAAPAAATWSFRKPWVLQAPSQFRPSAPPRLDSDAWARDYNEVKELGAKASTRRTEEQTRIARFWEYSLPPIYFGVVRSVADQPGRGITRNARLYAAAAQAMDDALISVFEAKYHFHFWRPVTAIRNGDADGNAATDRDAAWQPLIDNPMHPEFPSGHAILAGAVGAVLRAEIGNGPAPALRTTSPTAGGAARQWSSVDEFVAEVAMSRIYAGIHYRSAVEAGTEAGRRIGELAATRHLQPVRLGEAR